MMLRIQSLFRRSCLAVAVIGCLALPVSAQLIVIDDDGDRDTVAGPNVTTVDMSSHDNGGWDMNPDAFNDTVAYNGTGKGVPWVYYPDGNATYTFDTSLGLETGETYNVYAYWHEQSNVGETTYLVSDGLGGVVVDQTVVAETDIYVTDSDPEGNNTDGTAFGFQLLGQVTDDGDGVVTVNISNGGAAEEVLFLADAVMLLRSDVEALRLRLLVDRDTGSLTLRNRTAGAVTILGYSITSDVGSLDPGDWKSIAENYDSNNGGAVDPNDTWVELTDPASRTDLSEAELGGSGPHDGATLARYQEIDLDLGDGPWIQGLTEDLYFEYLLADGTVEKGMVEYTGNGDVPFEFGDLNFDGTAFALDDFTDVLLANLVTPTSEALSSPESYALGDLDDDQDVDQDDFRIFKDNYVAAGGSASDLAVAVPEPATIVMLLCLLGIMACWRVNLYGKLSAIPVLNRCNLIVAFAVACSMALGSLCYADFTLIDDFQSHVVGATVDTANGWTTWGDSVEGTVINDGGNQVAESAAADGDEGYQIALGAQTIANGTTGTIFFRARTNGAFFANATSGETTGADWWSKDEAGIYNNTYWPHTGDEWAPHFDDLDITAPTTPGVWDNVWLVVNNSTDTFDMYVNDTPAISADFRNISSGVGDLTHFFFGSNAPDSYGAIDDIYVDITGENLTNPAISFVTLSLEVNRTTGQVKIQNEGSNTFDVDFYQITSDLDSLDPGDWNSLEDQSIAGWMEGGASDASSLVEANLASSTVFAPSASQSLGAAYDTSVDSQDLVFSYTDVDGLTYIGGIEYVTGAADDADFDQDGDVDGADFLTWQRGFGAPGGQANGDANNDGAVNGADLTVWESQYGTGGAAGGAAAAAVPEPTTLGLLGLLLVGLTVRFIRKKEGLAMNVYRMGMIVAAVAVIAFAQTASADYTLDRDYKMGDSDGVIAGDDVFETFDDAGSSQPLAHDFPDVWPVYVDTTGRPMADANELGIQFDAAEGQVLYGARLGFPETSAATEDYTGISDRGFQLWVKPAVAGGAVQDIVMDTTQHGLRISEDGTWVMVYRNGKEYDSDVAVTTDQWYHVMVVRPLGAAASGATMYVDGVAVAAAAGGYTASDNFYLAVGGSTDGTTPGQTNNFTGIVDDLEMFVLGTSTGDPAVEYGTFDYATDNPIAADDLSGVAGDVDQDGLCNGDDVDDFIAGWLNVNLVNGIQVGDLSTIRDGDLNLDGITDLNDAYLLHNASVAAGGSGLAQLGFGVPEPASVMLMLVGFVALALMRRNK